MKKILTLIVTVTRKPKLELHCPGYRAVKRVAVCMSGDCDLYR